MAPRIKTLSVKGFRAFGSGEQTLNLPADITVVWGPNSTGKTSLAEAFEFLLTGQITRRELMASTQAEFADALRNAHLAAGEEVFVSAQITATDGKTYEVRRVLTNDYTKSRDCMSHLEIGGAAATEDDLASLGIVLSQPPLQAPVLAQHTLSYIFSVRPQDRATYFKALLEVTDLDDLRNDIAALADELIPLDDPLLTKFDTCVAIPVLNPTLDGLRNTIPDLAGLTAGIKVAARTLIEAEGGTARELLDERLLAIDKILAYRRSKTFPVREFEHNDLAGWNPPAPEIWTRLDFYLDAREKVAEEKRQLVSLFDVALKLPALFELTEPIDCPLCGTKSALTPERVQLIRQHVEDSKDFKIAKMAAKSALSHLSTSANSLATAAKDALPRYLKTPAIKRRETGFTIARIRELLVDPSAKLINPWLGQVRSLVRAESALRRSALAACKIVKEQTAETTDFRILNKLRDVFSTLATLRTTYVSVLDAYKASESVLCMALNEVLDVKSDTTGWQDFLDIARETYTLRNVLIERAARAAIKTELDAALRQIDWAKEQVLNDKFSDFSTLIQTWWERLRPDESTFFSTVQPRKGTKRTIDFKAGLTPNPDRSAPKVRDVIAVFSQSQLHCLGLAMFLARAQHEDFGFIILDDPVLSSDEDYRINFNSTVLTELLKLPMQVIVLTQDYKTWEELEIRYRHLSISTAQLFIDTPGEGSVIENTSDELLAKINRSKSLARGGHPDSRKECGVQLRNAGERFAKEMLVNNRRGKGDTTASLTDYDGKTLGWLCPRIDALLDHDPSHSGRLTAFKNIVNNACHDNAPPGNLEMKHACGEIRFFVKDYLGR